MEAKNTTRLGRRAMLAAALGGVAAAAGALAAPARVLGADGDPVLIGRNNSGASGTRINHSGSDPAFLVTSNAGYGVQGNTNAPSARAGVWGLAYQTGSVGVGGLNSASSCAGVLGAGTAGVVALQGGAALALDTRGKARFSHSGVATIPAGQRFVQIDVEGLTGDSFALATLQQYRANLWVQSITVSASSAAIYIYVSQRAPSATRVAWMVFEKPLVAAAF